MKNGVRELRCSLGLTQEEFGRMLGAKTITVYTWEHDRRLPGGVAVKLMEMIRTNGAVRRAFLNTAKEREE